MQPQSPSSQPANSLSLNLPLHKTPPLHNSALIPIPPPLHHLPQKLPSQTRRPRAHLPRLLPETPQIRLQHPRPNPPHLNPIRFQLMIPVQHDDVERRLGGAVADRFHVGPRFGPGAGGGEEGGRRGPGVGGEGGDHGEAGDEDEAWGWLLEEERHEDVGGDVGAGDVDVVGEVEGGAEGALVAEVGDVEVGACEGRRGD